MRRIVFSAVALLCASTLLSTPSLTAQNQDAADGEDSTEKADKADYRGPLPFYFGKLGLDEAQKEKLYAIDDDYAAKIAEIEKQIQKLKDERDARMETLLTPGQKLRLSELREAAAKKAEQEAAKEAAIKAAGDKPAGEN
jgi:Spy/CpxP family protein refolding chaperone